MRKTKLFSSLYRAHFSPARIKEVYSKEKGHHKVVYSPFNQRHYTLIRQWERQCERQLEFAEHAYRLWKEKLDIRIRVSREFPESRLRDIFMTSGGEELYKEPTPHPEVQSIIKTLYYLGKPQAGVITVV